MKEPLKRTVMGAPVIPLGRSSGTVVQEAQVSKPAHKLGRSFCSTQEYNDCCHIKHENVQRTQDWPTTS